MSNAESSKCPQCGAALRQDAPAGLCPDCLMLLNLKTETVFTNEASATQTPLPPEQIAPHFPHLEILECLGRGGMGVVYKARQKSLNRLVALKLLAPERVTDPKFAERFTREAHALAALNHPHIVTIHDFGQAGGYYFLLMEFVDGVNLRQLLEAGRLKPEEALAIVPPLCDALQYAHEQGIVHRDIKPANLLLDKAGRVKIADFGIAKMVGDGSNIGLTESQPAGTPQYMAPEQREHQRTDHRSDIYSLGVVLYEMLTGELPADKLQPPSRKVQIDVRLDEIVLRALEKSPELRFGTAAEFRTQVEAVTRPVVAGVKPADASASVTPQAVAGATGVAAFFGLLLLGIPIVDMFHVQKDRAYLAVVLIAALTSILGGFRVFSLRLRWNARCWRFKALSVAAFVTAVPVVGFAAFFMMNLRGFDNPALSEAVLVPLCFVGALTLPWAALVLRQASKAGVGSGRVLVNSVEGPRMSRLAVIGTCWVFATMAAGMGAWLVLRTQREGVAPQWWQMGLLIPLLIVAVSGPFGTTILGWLAVTEISRSQGRVHGLQLAVFNGLFYPLILLGAILAGGSTYAIHVLTNNPSVGRASMMLTVAVIIAVDVFIIRSVMRAVRREAAAAPPEGTVTNNGIKLASLALIFALMSTGLGALAALRAAGAWPAMALALIFAGLGIFMALPVRRLGAGKSAIVIAGLGMVLWPLAAMVKSQTNQVAELNGLGPTIEKVHITRERVVVQQGRYGGEGMIFLFGAKPDQWTPGGRDLDSMFDVTLDWRWLGHGANWSIKVRHGTYARYRLDGPSGPMIGKIVFFSGGGTATRDGSYVIGEFQPDDGKSLPISVRLDKSGPSAAKSGEHR